MLHLRSHTQFGNSALGPWDQLHRELLPHVGAALARRLYTSDVAPLCAWHVQKPRSCTECALAWVHAWGYELALLRSLGLLSVNATAGACLTGVIL